jgi:hypothetical protein
MEDIRGEPVPGADIWVESDDPIIIIDTTEEEDAEVIKRVSSWLGVKEDIISRELPTPKPITIRRTDVCKREDV